MRDRAKKEASRRVAARRAQLAEAEVELSRRQRLVEGCRARQEQARAQMLARLDGGTQAHRIALDRSHLLDLRQREVELLDSVGQQQKVVALAKSELESALASLLEASRELQIIEKHHEEQTRRARRDEQRRDQKLSDEIGAVIHGRTGRRGD